MIKRYTFVIDDRWPNVQRPDIVIEERENEIIGFHESTSDGFGEWVRYDDIKHLLQNTSSNSDGVKTKYPAILDACCGGRAFWFDKQNPNVLFCDRRVMEPEVVGSGKNARVKKCLPDVVMDFRDMDIPDCTFQLVVFDPPHLFLGENSYMAKSYGSLDRQTWKEDLRRGFSECFRVLKVGGILIFKWNECDVLLSEVLKCTDEKPLFGHPSGKSQKTHWLCFMKQESPVLGMEQVKCPLCGSEHVEQTADHSGDGYNGYTCNDCGCTFGN